MTRVATYWRRLSGLMVAVALCLLAFGPTLDLLVCAHDDAPIATNSQATEATATASQTSDHHDATTAADHGAADCPHGHCHHGAPGAPAVTAFVAARMTLAVRPAIPQLAVPTSDLSFGLDRPPRV